MTRKKEGKCLKCGNSEIKGVSVNKDLQEKFDRDFGQRVDEISFEAFKDIKKFISNIEISQEQYDNIFKAGKSVGELGCINMADKAVAEEREKVIIEAQFDFAGLGKMTDVEIVDRLDSLKKSL